MIELNEYQRATLEYLNYLKEQHKLSPENHHLIRLESDFLSF